MAEAVWIALRWVGTALAGWAIGDWFNERQTTMQAQAGNRSFGDILKANWLKWLVGALVTGVVFLMFSAFMNRNKKRK